MDKHYDTTAEKYGFCRIASILFTVLFIAGSSGWAQEYDTSGSGLEIGAGFGGFRVQSRPEWTGKYYGGGMMSLALKLYRGLAVQAGRDFSYGQDPRPEWIDYGKDVRIPPYKGTSSKATWVGLRYEIPAWMFREEMLGIDFISPSAGFITTKYGIRSDVREFLEVVEKGEDIITYWTATVSGPFVGINARWRLDKPPFEDSESWFGAGGFDIGVRYIRYTNSSTRHDNIMKPKSNFNCFEAYFVAYLKIRFFY